MSQPDPKPKPARKPKKKPAQPETPLIDKPIDPIVWILLGGLLIVLGGFFYLDTASAGAVDTRNGGSFIQLVFVVIYDALGRNLAFGLFGGLGLLILIFGIRGKLKQRANPDTLSDESVDE